MPVLKIESGPGRCVPPETNYGITTNSPAPAWETALRLRKGDPTVFGLIHHIYPRFMPWRESRTLIMEIAGKLGLPPTLNGFAWTDPTSFALAKRYAFAEARGEQKLAPEDLIFKCVDINDIRLYLVFFPMPKTPGIILSWQNPGTGLSIRLAEDLLKNMDALKEVECNGDAPPPTKYLPEGPSHAGLRDRVSSYLHRAAIDPELIKVTPDDVYLYMSGMAAIYAMHELLVEYRPGTSVVLGVVFHNTYHHIAEWAAKDGFKHFGPVDREGLDIFEAWLDEEAKAGRPVSYVVVEFPSNPLLASTDLQRLKKLADKHGFVCVVDDTVGSFCNIDVFPVSDILVTSLTKSFSGYADVLAGSTVLNPLSAHYAGLKKAWTAGFHNEFYTRDADTLLSNSDDYLERSKTLNKNAAAMATFLQGYVSDPASPVTRVLYPTLLPDRSHYDAFFRKPTPDFPEPGYGCLLSVDFESVETATTFYDTLAFYPGPHLGAHKSLSLCYNMLVFCKFKEEAQYHRSYGVLEESIRLSAGLEDEQDLLDTLKEALEVAAKKKAEMAAEKPEAEPKMTRPT